MFLQSWQDIFMCIVFANWLQGLIDCWKIHAVSQFHACIKEFIFLYVLILYCESSLFIFSKMIFECVVYWHTSNLSIYNMPICRILQYKFLESVYSLLFSIFFFWSAPVSFKFASYVFPMSRNFIFMPRATAHAVWTPHRITVYYLVSNVWRVLLKRKQVLLIWK